jgi:hypothetical protein
MIDLDPSNHRISIFALDNFIAQMNFLNPHFMPGDYGKGSRIVFTVRSCFTKTAADKDGLRLFLAATSLKSSGSFSGDGEAFGLLVGTARFFFFFCAVREVFLVGVIIPSPEKSGYSTVSIRLAMSHLLCGFDGPFRSDLFERTPSLPRNDHGDGRNGA